MNLLIFDSCGHIANDSSYSLLIILTKITQSVYKNMINLILFTVTIYFENKIEKKLCVSTGGENLSFEGTSNSDS